MRICHIAACAMAVALGASPLAHSAPGDGAVTASAEAGWTNGFDLAGGADGGALPVVAGWTSGYDLPSGGDEVLTVAVKLK